MSPYTPQPLPSTEMPLAPADTESEQAPDDLLALDADQIKGGPWGCSWCTYTGGNHNENMVLDIDSPVLGSAVQQ